MTTTEASPPEPVQTTPLAQYGGAKPPAPAWFEAALAAPRDDADTQFDGAKIAWRRWRSAAGDDAPGLVFVHGGVAHLGWWDFIAPHFAAHWTPLAVSLSGMGDSDHRKAYSVALYADEVAAAIEAAGLFDRPQPPIVVGHSFGGFATLVASVRHGARLRAAVVVDSPVRPSDAKRPRSDPKRRGGRVYADTAAALARFRLLPDQDCAHHFLLDHIAREALRPATAEDGSPGVAWKHDPNLWLKMQFTPRPPAELMQEVACPLAFMRGGRSRLVTDEVWTYMAQLNAGGPAVDVPDADHHVMLDQPLAFAGALNGLLAAWPPRAASAPQ